jgi:imidazolonepropionase-like amidohydrolase
VPEDVLAIVAGRVVPVVGEPIERGTVIVVGDRLEALVHQARLAVKEGLDREEALRALTLTPASILGVADRLGSLEPGKDADLCIWSGAPLDVMSRV